MKCTLIVNRNGLLSACPTDEVFALGDFHTDPARFVVVPVKIVPNTYKHLWENRDNAFVLHEELPAQTDDEGRVWYAIKDGYLVKVKAKAIAV